MQIWAESGKSALPICNYSQILYQFLTFTQNLKRSLGLAFVREIVRVHDGSICIKSGKTGGTIFEVTFAQHSM